MTVVPMVPASYAGVPIHARGFAVAAEYASSWSPPDDGEWEASEHVTRVWGHPLFPRHIVWKPDPGRVVVTQVPLSTPNMAPLVAFAAFALGQGAPPTRVVSYPLALRSPIRGPGRLAVPVNPHRCFRAWPPKGEPAHIEHVDGVPIEFRITTSAVNGSLLAYAEAFVGRAHENEYAEPRALIYPADGRHALLAPTTLDIVGFTAHLMDRLFMFAVSRRDQGLALDHRRLTGRRLGRSRRDAQGSDIEFEIRLPQPGRTLRYVGNYVSGYEKTPT